MPSRIIASAFPARFRRGLAAALAVAIIAVTGTGCSHQPGADARAVLRSPVTRTLLDVDLAGLVLVGAVVPGATPLIDLYQEWHR